MSTGLTSNPAIFQKVIGESERVSAPILLIMGVSGCGKSTLGARLASTLGWMFQEGDSLHPPANVAKMAAGRPLDDADREPWLVAVGAWIDERRAAAEAGVVTCSALKRAYRNLLTTGRPEVRTVFLSGSPELIAGRLAERSDHFMPASLLASQFAALEPPDPEEGAITVDAGLAVADQISEVIAASGLQSASGEPRRQS
jgi:carbohydrate kinase (thermoresistant glucokinase family)